MANNYPGVIGDLGSLVKQGPQRLGWVLEAWELLFVVS